MTTFIKTKFKVLDDQKNIDKYKLSANITEYHIKSKLSRRKKNIEIGPEIMKLCFNQKSSC